MFVDDLYLSFLVLLVFYFTSTQTTKLLADDTSISTPSSTNMTMNGNNTTVTSAVKIRLDQGKEIIHNAFSKMGKGTLIRASIVLAGIGCLVLMYIGLKTFLLRKKRQPKRYTLITDPTSMEEPLFNADDNEEEIEDDTLFVRK